MFHSRKYTVPGSYQFTPKIPSSDGILVLLNDDILVEIEGQRERNEIEIERQKKLKEAKEKEKKKNTKNSNA